MPNNRVLLIVNSVYHLLTAVHMRHTLLNDADADLIITDVTPQLRNCLPRVQETGLFDRVLFAAVQEMNQKYAGAKGEALDEGFSKADRLFRFALSDELRNYDTVYFANFDPFTRMLACRMYDDPCAFIGYEDGFSSYVIDYLREDRAPINRHTQGGKIRDKVEGILLYEPHLAMRGDSLRNLRLPKIRRDDVRLREQLNFIFAYTPAQVKADFLFLEQSFRAEGIKTNDIELMRLCQQTVGAGRFAVKPHPRNPENLPFQLGLTRRYPAGAPWELVLLNEDVAGQVLLTVCSNAALTGRLVFGMDIPTVMLYRLFEGKVLWKEDAVLSRYLLRFQRQFAGKNYYVPQTVYELKAVLGYLGEGGVHG